MCTEPGWIPPAMMARGLGRIAQALPRRRSGFRAKQVVADMRPSFAIESAQFALQVQAPDRRVDGFDIALLGQAVGNRLQHPSATSGPWKGPWALIAEGWEPDMPAAQSRVQSPFSPASGLTTHSIRVVSPRLRADEAEVTRHGGILTGFPVLSLHLPPGSA